MRAALDEPTSHDDGNDGGGDDDVYSPNKSLIIGLGTFLLPFYIVVPLLMLYYGCQRFKVSAFRLGPM